MGRIIGTTSLCRRCLILLLVLFVIGCGGKKAHVTPPKLSAFKMTLSKRIAETGNTGSEQTNENFSVVDTQVISSVRLKNVTGDHSLRWEWYRPDGTLYCSTRNTSLKTAPGKYRKEVLVRHKLSVFGEKAARYPGRWNVKAYIDGQVFASETFHINDANIEEFPDIQSQSNMNKWGLIIGVENYAEATMLPTAEFVKSDALLVKEYFIRFLGIPKENIITLFDNDATKGRIQAYVKEHLQRNLDNTSMLFVYFAGHGTVELNEKSFTPFILPSDGHPRYLSSTAYKLDDFYNDLDALKIRKIVVFIDSCFSGAGEKDRAVLPPMLEVNRNELNSRKIISIQATKNTQTSHAYPDKKHGLFTYFLLKGLRGTADYDFDMKITIEELFTYIEDNVENVSRRMGFEQTPFSSPAPPYLKRVKMNLVDINIKKQL